MRLLTFIGSIEPVSQVESFPSTSHVILVRHLVRPCVKAILIIVPDDSTSDFRIVTALVNRAVDLDRPLLHNHRMGVRELVTVAFVRTQDIALSMACAINQYKGTDLLELKILLEI